MRKLVNNEHFATISDLRQINKFELDGKICYCGKLATILLYYLGHAYLITFLMTFTRCD